MQLLASLVRPSLAEAPRGRVSTDITSKFAAERSALGTGIGEAVRIAALGS